MTEPNALSPAILKMKPGEHFCCIYQTEAEHRTLVTSYVRSGLELGHKVIYVTDTHSAETVTGYLSDDGLEVEPFLESGQLAFMNAFDSYLRGGEFDPNAMLELLRQETQAAMDQGFSALRIAEEMTWLLRGLPGSEKIVDYESKLNGVLHESTCMSLCQFDRRMFEPELLLAVISVHPQVILGTELFENSFYVPPYEVLGTDPAPAVLENVFAEMREKQAVRKALAEHEALIRSALDMLRDVFLVLDMDAHILLQNTAVNRVTGYSEEEIHGLPLAGFFAEEDVAVLWENLHRAASEGRSCFSVNLLAKDGVRIPMEFEATLLRDTSGNPLNLCILGRDMTGHVIAHDTLREERDVAEKYLDLAGVIILVLDKEGKVVVVNRHGCDLLEYDEGEIVGADWCGAFVPEESREDVRAVFRHLQRGEQGFDYYENHVQARSGELRLIAWNNITLRDEAGDFSGTLSSGMDITESRRDQQRLAWQASADAAVAEVSQALLSLTDSEEVAQLMLKQARRLTGSSIGFVGYIDAQTGRLVGPAMTEGAWTDLSLTEKGVFDQFARPWGWVLENGKPLLSNNAAEEDLPFEKALGDRTRIERFLLVPALIGGMVVGQIALANSSRDYEQRDLELITRMATHFALAIERKRMEEDIKDAHDKLQVWVEQRGKELNLLNEMGNLLQTCQTIGEAHLVIGQFAERLFSGLSGAIYYNNKDSGLFEVTTEWGTTGQLDAAFSRNDCWALRRGQLHCIKDTPTGLLCTHLGEPKPASYICAPMIAQGEALGVLHLRCRSDNSPCHILAGEDGAEHLNELALSFSGHVALALVNLRLNETLREQAVRDGLTGVFNRRFMEESLAREIAKAKRSLSPVSVVMLDLDHFKMFNDDFGHEAGDILLQKLAALLQSSFREADVVCRYGGEEFVLMLPGASLDYARMRTEEIQESLRSMTVQYRGRFLRALTISAGLATLPDHGLTGEELLKAADTALYRAKNEGRDRLVIAEPLTVQEEPGEPASGDPSRSAA